MDATAPIIVESSPNLMLLVLNVVFISMIVPFFVGYFFGSIPFGLILTKMAGLGDVRKVGSGNIGATNVLRMGNKGIAAATLLADGLKGVVPILLLRSYFPEVADLAPMVALGAFMGHLYPVWLKFAGGKGIAVYIGTLLTIYWPAGLIFAATWLLMAIVMRYSSLAALVATLASPIALYFLMDDGGIAAIMFSIMTALAWNKHKPNIERLTEGTEPKIGAKE